MSDERPTPEHQPTDDQPTHDQPTYDRPTYDRPGEGQPGAREYPGYAAAPSPYPSAPSPYPSAPPGGGAPAASVAQPPSVRNAVRLMWVGAAISLISLVVTFATRDSLKSQLQDSVRSSGQNVTQSQLDAVFAAAIAISVIITVIEIFLWLWMAWKNGQGRQWARIVATVLGVLNVLLTLFSFVGNQATGGTRILAVVNLVIAIAILILLWRKESNDFYRARSARQYA